MINQRISAHISSMQPLPVIAWYPAPVTNQWHSPRRPRSEGTFLPAWHCAEETCRTSGAHLRKAMQSLEEKL